MAQLRNLMFLFLMSGGPMVAWSQVGETGEAERRENQDEDVEDADEAERNRRLQFVVGAHIMGGLPPALVSEYVRQFVKVMSDICTRAYKGKSTLEVRYSSISGWGIKGGCEGLSEADFINFTADARYVARKIAARLSGET